MMDQKNQTNTHSDADSMSSSHQSPSGLQQTSDDFIKQDLTQLLQQLLPSNTDTSGQNTDSKDTSDDQKVSIGHIMSQFESRGFGPLLFVPALIAVMPTGGIPGIPTACGVMIVLISGQMLMNKTRPWLPDMINKIDFEPDKLQVGVEYASKVTRKIDKLTRPRLQGLSSSQSKKLVAAACILAGAAMMPLEIVPFAVMIPAASVILFAIGLITKDGYALIVAFLLNLVALYFVVDKAVSMMGS